MCCIVWRHNLKAFSTGSTAGRCYCGNGRYTRWEDVRFQIEREQGMVIWDLDDFADACRARQRYPIAGDTCVVGYPLSLHKQPKDRLFLLGAAVDVSTVETIVVMRVPTGRQRSGKRVLHMYVPPTMVVELHKAAVADRLQQLRLELKTTLGEEARLELVQRLVAVEFGYDTPWAHRRRRAEWHPSRDAAPKLAAGLLTGDGNYVRWDALPRPPVPDDYLCHRCLNYFGYTHLRDDCPSWDRPKWQDMATRGAPTGIPTSERRQVSWDAPLEAVEAAPWVDMTHQLWARR